MRHHVLAEGTVLDERYRIESLLGEGGFGITYAARNIRIDSKVAIKELFWRNHCERDAAVSPEVTLPREEDAPTFQRQKESFLREARMLRDFSNRAEVARVLDYFEANGTAYIVMEYVEGETLGARVSANGPLDAEEAFRRFLPLVDALAAIHKGDVIHRDISPDNIMVQPDGSLKLIDFGAARQFSALGGEKYSVIAKDSYAPPEQYDKNGRLGPWTDVYALCATLYTCVTGQAPIGSMQRMFLDELRIPSELRGGLDRRYEAVILRGMELSASKRWQSMEELAEAMRDALPAPAPEPKPPLWRRALVFAGVGLLCAAIALGAVYYPTYRREHRFDGVATETFYLIAPGNMSVQEYAQVQRELDGALEEFAGAGNYVTTVVGSEFHVELPLKLFEDRDIGAVIQERVRAPLSAHKLSLKYQIQVDWDDPTNSMFAGRNQIQSGAFTDETAIFSYSISDNRLTAGQRANLLMDFKTRLDALDTPYAFGTAYGNPDVIVYRVDPRRIGPCVTETIGEAYPLKLAGEASFPFENLSFDSNGELQLRVVECEDGCFGLRYEMSDYEAQEIGRMMRSLQRAGMDALYLQTENDLPLAKVDLEAPIEDGALEFREFMFEGMERIDAEHRYILDYLAALVNDTQLPTFCTPSGDGVWSAENGGSLCFGESVDERFGLRTRLKAGNLRMRELLARVAKETGYRCSESDGMFWIELNLSANNQLFENLEAAVGGLLEKYPFSEIICDNTVALQLMEENGSERYRINLETQYDISTDAYYPFAWSVWTELFSESQLSYEREFQEWWDAFPMEEYGYEKRYR